MLWRVSDSSGRVRCIQERAESAFRPGFAYTSHIITQFVPGLSTWEAVLIQRLEEDDATWRGEWGHKLWVNGFCCCTRPQLELLGLDFFRIGWFHKWGYPVMDGL